LSKYPQPDAICTTINFLIGKFRITFPDGPEESSIGPQISRIDDKAENLPLLIFSLF